MTGGGFLSEDYFINSLTNLLLLEEIPAAKPSLPLFFGAVYDGEYSILMEDYSKNKTVLTRDMKREDYSLIPREIKEMVISHEENETVRAFMFTEYTIKMMDFNTLPLKDFYEKRRGGMVLDFLTCEEKLEQYLIRLQ